MEERADLRVDGPAAAHCAGEITDRQAEQDNREYRVLDWSDGWFPIIVSCLEHRAWIIKLISAGR